MIDNLLGLCGCRRNPLFGRSHRVLADSLERLWDITITSEQGPTRPIFQLHPIKEGWAHSLIDYAMRSFLLRLVRIMQYHHIDTSLVGQIPHNI